MATETNSYPAFLRQIFENARTQLPGPEDELSPEETLAFHQEVISAAEKRIDDEYNFIYYQLATYIIETRQIKRLPLGCEIPDADQLSPIELLTNLLATLRNRVLPDLKNVPIDQIRKYMGRELPLIISPSFMAEDVFRDQELVEYISHIWQEYDVIEAVTSPTPEKLRAAATYMEEKARKLDEVLLTVDPEKDSQAINELEEASTQLLEQASRLRVEAKSLESEAEIHE